MVVKTPSGTSTIKDVNFRVDSGALVIVDKNDIAVVAWAAGQMAVRQRLRKPTG